jgi:hypothetical protein
MSSTNTGPPFEAQLRSAFRRAKSLLIEFDRWSWSLWVWKFSWACSKLERLFCYFWGALDLPFAVIIKFP